jgi:hypothetical protein
LRSGERTNSDRGGPAAFAARCACSAAISRDPMPHQRRRSGQQFPSVAGPNRVLLFAWRPWCARRFARLYRLRCAAILRFNDCQIDNGRCHTNFFDRSDAAGAGRIFHHWNQNDGSVSRGDDAQRRIPRGQIRYRVCRAHHVVGQFRADALASSATARLRLCEV